MGVSVEATEGGTAMAAAAAMPIIAYHFVGAPGAEYAFRDDELPYVTDAAVFAEHLAGLVELGFGTVTLEQYLGPRALPEQPVVLTFDDGHVSFLEHALGPLTQHGYTATLFMVTDFIGQPGYLSARQLAELAHLGVEIGSHGCSHRPLTALPGAQMRDEVRRSKQVLEDTIGHAVTMLALPHGFGSRAVEQAAHDAGYATICTSRFGVNRVPAQSFCLDRVSVKNPLPWSDLQPLLEPGGRAYQRALVKDRLKTVAKWLVQTHKRCE